jgi:hypothetical protein
MNQENEAMDDKIRRELDTLLSALADGSLRQDQQNRLGQLLEQYPEAQDIYLAYFNIHTELSLTGGLCNAIHDRSPETLMPPAVPTSSVRARPVRLFLAGVAALIVVLVVVWLLSLPRSDPSTPIVARLVSADEARWASDPTDAGVAGEFAPGEVRIEEGVVHIQMISGVELVLKAPSVIELVDATTVRLKQGNLTVSVSDESEGFRVFTPMAYLVDMGTEFGVEVEESGTTEVHVFQGVVVAKSAASGSVVPIVAQEAGRIDAPRDRLDLAYGEFVSVDLDRSRFRGLSPSTADAVVHPEAYNARQTIRPLAAGTRIVFLGDHATSCETHLLLINQTFRDLPAEAAPRLFNSASILPLSFTEEHYRQYVESFAPTHAVLEFGPEIAGFSQPRSPEDFRQAITRLVDRLEQSGIEPIIATGYAVPQSNLRASDLLDSYNDFLRELAVQRGYRLADVDLKSRKYPDSEPGLADSYMMPTFEGYRVMAAALIESFGYPEIPVPQSLDVSLLPGVVTSWKMRVRHLLRDRLDADSVTSLAVDETWTQLTLPQHDKLSQRLAQPGRSFLHQHRARGFATHLTDGGDQVVQAVSSVESEMDRNVFFNTGARLLTIWLNGEKILDRDNPWEGWHPGRERIPAKLKAGRNQVIIESRDAFFLSITSERDWALPRPLTSGLLDEHLPHGLTSKAVDVDVPNGVIDHD